MTSASSPSGVVTRSGVYDSSYEAWQAFDASPSTLWISETWQTPAWIAYQWANGPKTVERYALTFKNGAELSTRAPKDFTLEGWDGSTWVVVDTRQNETRWAGSERREYPVSNPGSYLKYRLNFADDNDERTGVVVISLGRIELIASDCSSDGGSGGSGGATSGGATSGGATSGGATSGGATSGGATSGGATSGGATSGGATSGSGATSGGATSGGGATSEGGAAGEGGGQCNPVSVPPMTSSNAPSGEVTRSGVYDSSYEAWQAFDASPSTLWISKTWQTPAWIAYEWADGPKTVERYALTFKNGAQLSTRAPKDFTLEGWKENAWVVLDTRRNETAWAGSERREYGVPRPGSYAKYRLNVTDDNDERDGVVVVSLGRIELIGTDCEAPDGRVGQEPSINVSANVTSLGVVAPGAQIQDSLLLWVHGLGTTVTVTGPAGSRLYCGPGAATCPATTGTNRLQVYLDENKQQTFDVEATAPTAPGPFTLRFNFSYDNSSGTVTVPVDIMGVVAGSSGSAGSSGGGTPAAGPGSSKGCSVGLAGTSSTHGLEWLLAACSCIAIERRARRSTQRRAR